MARAGRRVRRERHGAVRRFVGRAIAGPRAESDAVAAHRDLQRPPRPAAPDGLGRVRYRVEYRAWQPPSCLHPTIGVHAPLVLDLVDLWSERSLGGCTWHVAHPGGRHFERFPVNALEAESRRTARFFPIGHTGGLLSVPPPGQNRDYR